MTRLREIELEGLREELQMYEQRRPIVRLLAAIIYKQGPSVPTLAEWLDVREATIYSWFDRLETEPTHEAVQDRPRPGRPAKLTEKERASFSNILNNSPEEVGFDAGYWTPRLAQTYLEESFDVKYTTRHVRRLMNEVDGG